MKNTFRKALCILCMIAMLLPLGLQASAASFADADGDGLILSSDARLILRAAVGLSPWTDDMLQTCDIDGDKALTATDARLILRLSVGHGNEDDSCINGMDGAELVGLTSKDYKIYKKDGITYIDGILIANKTYALPSDYNPGKLLDECNTAFQKMAYDAYYNDGIYLYELSGYRSYATQNRLYNNYVAADGKQLADTYSARPGHSEHQSGLALDVNSVEYSFSTTKEAKWLAANCYKYGFILRYPEGKTDMTGYIYEAWHIRYVGVEIATKIHNSGLCLEEYYGITSRYNY